MPPPLAALLLGGLAAYLLMADLRQRKGSLALWIPIVWTFVIGGRPVSAWLQPGAPVDTLDGSPLDRAVFAVLIAAGAAVLARRRFPCAPLLARNIWMLLFLVVAASSVMWSPFPVTSFKRLIKLFGNLIMALILVTDASPAAATSTVLLRLGILTLPLSALLVNYYPLLGRAYHMGQPMFTGVAMQKNGLAQLCLLSSIAACWNLLYQRTEQVRIWPLRVRVELVVLALAVWLLYKADSATSTTCTILALAVLGVGRAGWIARKPRRLATLLVAGVLGLAIAGPILDLWGAFLAGVNRDTTLTTRVPMWNDLLGSARNPWVGAGYEIFWQTPEGLRTTEAHGLTNAHNGYLETYLNLGVVGLFLLAASIISAVPRLLVHLDRAPAPAMLLMVVVIVVPLYNWTEAQFRGASNLWTLLMLAQLALSQQPPGTSCQHSSRRVDAGVRPRTATRARGGRRVSLAIRRVGPPPRKRPPYIGLE